MNDCSTPQLPPTAQTNSYPPSYASLNSLNHDDQANGGDSRLHPPLPPVVPLALAPPSLHSVSPASSPSRQEEIPVELEGIPDTSPPPPYSPRRRWSIALSRASNSLQRNVAINRIHSPEVAATLYERIQALHQESSNGVSFLWSFSQILLSTIGCLAILIVLLLVPLVILVVGIVFLNDCPTQSFIPLSLIVGGVAIILKILLLIVEGIATRNSASISRRLSPIKQVVVVCCWRSSNTIFNAFLLAWTVTASYFVFSRYHEVVEMVQVMQNKNFPPCNEILYKFSFAVLTLFGASFIMCCFCLSLGCCCVSFSLHRAKSGRTSPGEDVCNGDWVVGGEGGGVLRVVGRAAAGSGGGGAENQEIRIQEIGTEDDERSEVSYQELQAGNTSNDGSEGSIPRNGISVIRHVPVEVTMGSLDGGLMSVDEGEEDVSMISSALLPGMHLDSQDLDTASSRLGSMTLSSNRASYGYQFPEMTTLASGHVPTSYMSRSLQRQPKSYSGINSSRFGGAHHHEPSSLSSSTHVESTPYLPFQRQSSEHSAAALRNTTSSYVNLAPIPSVRHALTLSECARSNPQLYYKSPQRTLQQQQQKLKEAKTRSMESHAARGGGRPQYPSSMAHSQDLSGSSMREASLNGSSLYITVLSDGYSTTVV